MNDDLTLEKPKKKKAEFGNQGPIVPPANLSSNALLVVVIIMSFLACLTLGFVTLIQDASNSWQNQISGEMTIQVKPSEDRDIEQDLVTARDLVLQFSGTTDAEIIEKSTSAELLEPWLGEDFSLDELPVPRMIVVTIDKTNPPDFQAIRTELQTGIPGAYLDDHRAWTDRLVSMAQNTVLIGVGLLILVLTATTLTVIFATRGAMSVNNDIIEVLHFVGAESSFVANEFQRHFMLTGLFGGTIGGILAAVTFFLTNLWQNATIATTIDEQSSSLFGSFQMGASGYFGIIMIIITVSILTALTTRLTVIRTIREIDLIRSDPSLSDQV